MALDDYPEADVRNINRLSALEEFVFALGGGPGTMSQGDYISNHTMPDYFRRLPKL